MEERKTGRFWKYGRGRGINNGAECECASTHVVGGLLGEGIAEAVWSDREVKKIWGRDRNRINLPLMLALGKEEEGEERKEGRGRIEMAGRGFEMRC